MDRKALGDFGEWVAAEWIKRQGYAIIEHNFRCRVGEIDLIAARGGTLVFLEVKTRSGDAFGRPALAVDRKKQEHLRQAAAVYLRYHAIENVEVRFDVVEVSLEHLKGVMAC